MKNILISTIVLIFIFIFFVKLSNKLNKEDYNNACNFNVRLVQPLSTDECFEKCIEQCPENAQKCVTECKHFIPNPSLNDKGESTCEIASDDIRGTTLSQCINNCKTYGPEGCRKYRVKSDGKFYTGDYTNSLEEIERCDDKKENIQYCSPCVKKCKECEEPNKCPFNFDGVNNTPVCDGSVSQEVKDVYNSFKIILNAIPESNQITLVWNIIKNQNQSITNIKKFIIMISKKGNDIVRTFEKPFEGNRENYTHVVDGLVNNVQYTVVINAISKDSNPIVKSSNTLDVIPSEVNLVNFSKMKSNIVNKESNLSTHLFKNLMGKTFEISL